VVVINIRSFSSVCVPVLLPLGPSLSAFPSCPLFACSPSKTKKNPLWNKRNSRILEATERLALTLIFRLHVAVVSFFLLSAVTPVLCAISASSSFPPALCVFLSFLLLSLPLPLPRLSKVEPDNHLLSSSSRWLRFQLNPFCVRFTPPGQSSPYVTRLLFSPEFGFFLFFVSKRQK